MPFGESRRRSRRALLAVAVLFAGSFSVTALLGGDDWPEFRGPTGQGHAEGEGFPRDWNDSAALAWRRPVPGAGWSSPIVWGEKVYLTTAVPQAGSKQQSLMVAALDAAGGMGIWEREVFRHATPRIHTKNSHASGTPITDGEHVWAHFGTNGTVCLTTDGKIVWSTTELRYDPVHGTGGSPALIGDLLVIHCDGADRQFVVALDKASGKERWRTPRPKPEGKGFSFSTPLAIEVEGETQIVSAGPGHVLAYRPADGSEIWRVSYGKGYSVVPRPVFAQGLVIVSSGYDEPVIFAIRPTGRGDVTKTHVAWTRSRGAPLNPSPLAVGDDLYLVSDRGIATCLDLKTGAERWMRRLGGGFSASPVHAGGLLWFLNEEGELSVLEAGPEAREVARSDLDARTLATPAFAGGAVYVRTERHLYKFASRR